MLFGCFCSQIDWCPSVMCVCFCRGSVIAKIIGNNVQGKPDAFVEQVLMYVYEEVVDGMKLTEIINTKHENIKYLPGCMPVSYTHLTLPTIYSV